MRGACVSWCALFTQRQPPEHMRDGGTPMCRARSFSLPILLSLSLSLSPFFALSRPLSFSPSRPSNIGVDKPPMHCETPRAILANRGTA